MHDIHDEPQYRGRFQPEDADRLDEEPARASGVVDDDRGWERSIADEPGLAWSGINRETTPGFAETVRHRRESGSRSRNWLLLVLIGLLTGPFAIFGAFFKSLVGESGFGYMAVVIIGPVIEEMLKVAGILWLVERRPWVVPSVGGILLVGVLGALGFAAIENVMYLTVYIPDHGPALARWRWTVCVVMHIGCSFIAAKGVAVMWKRSMMSGQPADVSAAFPYFVTAIAIHGGYNALAVLLHSLGLSPE